MASFAQISDDALQRITDIATVADQWASETLDRMDNLATASDALLTVLDSTVFSPDFDDLNLTYIGSDDPTEPDYTAEGEAVPTLTTLNTVADFSYAEDAYVDLVKTNMQTSLNNTLTGTLIVSTAVWDALWARATDKLGAQQVGEEWRASDGGAAQGWELPSETTLARLGVAEDETSKRTAAITYEKATQEAVQRREDLWNAIQNGTQFEQIHQQHHNNVWNRALESAKATVDRAIAINQLLIASDNLKVQVFAASWNSLAQRISATASMFQARIGEQQLKINDAQAKFSYENAKITKGLQTEQGEVGLAVNKAKIAIDNAIGTLSSLANLAAAITQGAFAASDVNVGTSANINENWSVQGPI